MSTSIARKKAKGWCFTVNNPVHRVLYPDGLPDTIKYIVYQVERGVQGTEHLQGFVYFTKQTLGSSVKKTSFIGPEGQVVEPFVGAHLEVAKGKPEDNRSYCTKEDSRVDGPWELGVLPGGSGERTDLREAASRLMKSGDIRDIDPAVFLKYASGCLKLAALAPPPRRDNLKVISIVGSTGIGKSYAVHDLFPEVYTVNMGNSGLWWDGYTGQPVVHFEEFKGQVQLQKMLQILDPYPLRLEVKGGLVPARFSLVFITSNSTPDKWYRDDGSRAGELAALYRRLDFSDPTAIPVKPHGLRFIESSSRLDLHRRLDLALQIEDLQPKPGKSLSITNSAPRAPTPVISDSEEPPPRLKRSKKMIILDEATQQPDICRDSNGDYMVSTEIAKMW